MKSKITGTEKRKRKRRRKREEDRLIQSSLLSPVKKKICKYRQHGVISTAVNMTDLTDVPVQY